MVSFRGSFLSAPDFASDDDVTQYMEGGSFWDSLKADFQTVGHGIASAAKAVQNNPVVRDVEKGVVKVGASALRDVAEPVIDTVADGAVSLVGMPELAPAIDAGVHRGANWLQNKAVHGVDHAIDSSAGGGYWAAAVLGCVLPEIFHRLLSDEDFRQSTKES